jgi:pimeloyl-ACP methyl ester carboxylesterase
VGTARGASPDWRERLGEARVVLEYRSTANRDALPAAPAGEGRPVLLVPGLLAPENTLRPLALWLRASGWNPVRSGIGLNVDCSQVLLDKLTARLEAAYTRRPARAIVIGQSRGGLLARALAVQRPDLVAASVALGSPITGMLDVSPGTARQLRMLAKLGSVGVPGFLSPECEEGPCCERFRAAITAPAPEDVRLIALWSGSDGMVNPEACRDPHAECHEVSSSHIGMGLNAGVWRRLVGVLGDIDPALSIAR